MGPYCTVCPDDIASVGSVGCGDCGTDGVLDDDDEFRVPVWLLVCTGGDSNRRVREMVERDLGGGLVVCWRGGGGGIVVLVPWCAWWASPVPAGGDVRKGERVVTRCVEFIDDIWKA